VKILVVAAHPDDEVLGCGGAMARHALKGDKVKVVILAEGVTSRDVRRRPRKHADGLSALARSARSAGKVLGVGSVSLYGFPDNRMDSCDLLDIVKVVEQHVKNFKPDVIYTHFAGDLNIDHAITARAVLTACRPLPGSTIKRILFFEVPSSTEWQVSANATPFAPDYFIDIDSTLERKLEALKHYQSEMRKWPHARSIEAVVALARWRGASVGLGAAEAFVMGREILRELPLGCHPQRGYPRRKVY
jgi:LmbE family N-acetylglucosaminyl deacetylase